jgi:hypothetical protein
MPAKKHHFFHRRRPMLYKKQWKVLAESDPVKNETGSLKEVQP